MRNFLTIILAFLLLLYSNSINSQIYKQIQRSAQKTIRTTTSNAKRQIETATKSYNNQTSKAKSEYYKASKKIKNQNRSLINNAHRKLMESDYNQKLNESEQVLKKRISSINSIHNYQNINKEEFIQSSSLKILRNFPIYDINTGQLLTLDSYTRNMMYEMGIPENSEGNDLYNDPLGTAFLLMFDEDYLFDARLIDDGNGNWVSINELNGKQSDAIRSSHLKVKRAIASNNVDQINISVENFINELNNLYEGYLPYPDFKIIIGLYDLSNNDCEIDLLPKKLYKKYGYKFRWPNEIQKPIKLKVSLYSPSNKLIEEEVKIFTPYSSCQFGYFNTTGGIILKTPGTYVIKVNGIYVDDKGKRIETKISEEEFIVGRFNDSDKLVNTQFEMFLKDHKDCNQVKNYLVNNKSRLHISYRNLPYGITPVFYKVNVIDDKRQGITYTNQMVNLKNWGNEGTGCIEIDLLENYSLEQQTTFGQKLKFSFANGIRYNLVLHSISNIELYNKNHEYKIDYSGLDANISLVNQDLENITNVEIGKPVFFLVKFNESDLNSVPDKLKLRVQYSDFEKKGFYKLENNELREGFYGKISDLAYLGIKQTLTLEYYNVNNLQWTELDQKIYSKKSNIQFDTEAYYYLNREQKALINNVILKRNKKPRISLKYSPKDFRKADLHTLIYSDSIIIVNNLTTGFSREISNVMIGEFNDIFFDNSDEKGQYEIVFKFQNKTIDVLKFELK